MEGSSAKVTQGDYDILGQVFESKTLRTSLIRLQDQSLGLRHEVTGALEGDLPAVFKAAARRASATPHPSFERVLSVEPGAYITAFEAAERLSQLHTSAVYSGDGCLPVSVVERLVADLVDGLETLHVAGQTHGPFTVDNVVLSTSGQALFVGLPMGAVEAHRSGQLATTSSDLRCLADVLDGLCPLDASDEWLPVRTLVEQLKSGTFADAEDVKAHLASTGSPAASHGATVAWLESHYKKRLERWRHVSQSEDSVETLSRLLSEVPVREAPVIEAPQDAGVLAETVVLKTASRAPRRRGSIDDMLGSLIDTDASGDADSAPVLEVVEVAFGVVRKVTVLYPGEVFKIRGQRVAQLTYEGAKLERPKDASGEHYRLGQAEPLGQAANLEVGDRASIEFDGSVYRFRLDRAARRSGRSFGKRFPWKMWATCIAIALGSHLGFGFGASMFISANIELPTQVDEKELFAREINLDELKEKKPKPKKKKKKKPKVKPKKKKKKPKPKKKTIQTNVPKEPQPVISNNLREKLNKRIRKARASGASTAQSLLKQVMAPSDSNAPSLSQIRSNLDAVASTKGRSGTTIVGSLINGGPGDRIVARGAGGGVVGTKSGVAGGTGRLAQRSRRGKVRGKVRSVRALAKVRGSLSKAEVYKVISRATGRIQRCYEKQLMRSKKKLSGKITAQWDIKTNGRVAGTRVVLNTLGNAKVASCVLGVIRGLRFPRPKGGSVNVKYPFIFSAR